MSVSSPYLALLNPQAGSAGHADALQAWVEARGHELVETRSAEESHDLARAAAARGQVVLAAGGDGTIHAVVNGLLAAGAERPRLGVIPLGTGNDLARSLGLPEDPAAALDVIDAGHIQPIDAFRATLAGRVRYGANVASLGLGGQLARSVTSESKQRWGPLAYVLSGVNEAAHAEFFPLGLVLDGRALEERALGVLVANGRYAAGGFDVAPQAKIDDGLLEVIVVKPEGFVDRAWVAALLVAGDYTHSDSVLALRARRIEISPPPGLSLNLDGETEGEGNCLIEILPAALGVFVPSS